MRNSILALLILFSTLIHANYSDNFGLIPIMHEGRIKPISTLAKLKLEEASSKSSIDNLSSTEWFAELLFRPEKSYSRNIFKIHNDDVKNILGLNVSEKYFNFIHIYQAFSKNKLLVNKILESNESELDLSSKQIKKLYLIFSDIMSYSRSFSMFFSTNANASFYEMITSHQALSKEGQEYFKMINEDSVFIALTMIPPTNSETDWKSPWEICLPNKCNELGKFKKLYDSYDNPDAFHTTSESFINREFQNKFRIESTINKINLVNYTITFSLLTLFLVFVYQFKKFSFLLKFSFMSLSIGTLLLSTFVICRSYILNRPPVSNLYESIIFVALTALILSLIYEFKFKNLFGLFIGSFLSITLLFLSIGYKQEGDNLSMVVAVLDTNFWLATHVLTISIGYGTTLVASLLAHVYLLKANKENEKKIFSNLYGLIILSLLFVCLGTILGGIWADQSWGRFWGWDPKENGALLICLWLIFVTHGKIGRIFSHRVLAALIALSSCVVIIAWFGVNLLNVGLHSYGFSSDTAMAISLFCLIEISLVIYLLYFRKDKTLLMEM